MKPPAPPRNVIINGIRPSETQLSQVERLLGIRIADGEFWYDRTSGAWGLIGTHCLGVIPANLELGGALAADASRGRTGVFINGRELHSLDVVRLQLLGPVLPGRYWVDALGNCGYQGSPWPFVNLFVLASQRSRQTPGSVNSSYDGQNSFLSDGSFSAFSTKDVHGNTLSAYSGA